jgi:hypothetical protein
MADAGIRSRIFRRIRQSFDDLDNAIRNFDPTYLCSSDDDALASIMSALAQRVRELTDDNVLDLVRSRRNHEPYPLNVGDKWTSNVRPLFDQAWLRAYAILSEPATFFNLEDNVAYFEGRCRAFMAVPTVQDHVRILFINLVSVLRDVEERIAKRPTPSPRDRQGAGFIAPPPSFRPRLLSVGPLAQAFGAAMAFERTACRPPGIPEIEAPVQRAIEVFIEKYPKYLTFLGPVQEFSAAVGEALTSYIIVNLNWSQLQTLEQNIVIANGEREEYFNRAVGAGLQLEAEQIINAEKAEPRREPK